MYLLGLFLIFLSSIYSQDEGFSCNSYSYLGLRELQQMDSNCTDIMGHVWVLSKETPYDEMMRVFKTVKNIIGCVSIRNTNFPDLAFFATLENVTCSQNEVQATPMTDGFYIFGNRNMTKLGLDNIKNIWAPNDMKATVKDAHKDFCFSETEKAILSPNSSYRHCSEPYECSFKKSSRKDGSQIPVNCSVINWDIELDGNIKEEYLERLQTVKLLYGQLIMENNKEIEMLNLTNLELIALPTYPPKDMIVLRKNPKLTNIVLNEKLIVSAECKGISFDDDKLSKKKKVSLIPNSTYAVTCCDYNCAYEYGGDYDQPVGW